MECQEIFYDNGRTKRVSGRGALSNSLQPSLLEYVIDLSSRIMLLKVTAVMDRRFSLRVDTEIKSTLCLSRQKSGVANLRGTTHVKGYSHLDWHFSIVKVDYSVRKGHFNAFIIE